VFVVQTRILPVGKIPPYFPEILDASTSSGPLSLLVNRSFFFCLGVKTVGVSIWLSLILTSSLCKSGVFNSDQKR